MTDLLNISALAPRLRRKEISPVDITRDCLNAIAQRNPLLNAFITVMADSALDEARRAEAEITRGEWRSPLHGIPIALKDLIDVSNAPTTAASALYKGRIPVQDAELVRRLRAAGAVIIGKNNLHECAYGGSSLISYFGEVHNPRDPGRIAGGSSGGSAAAVVAGMCYAAIGTDTAGSVREPAALCGCVGLKPTYGRVSIRGVIPLSTSLDHVGPLARSVEDAAIVLQAIASYDPEDITTVNVAVADYAGAVGEKVSNLRIGIPREYFFDDLEPEIETAVEQALKTIRSLAGGMKDVRLDVPTDRTLQMAEAYAYHAEDVAQHSDLLSTETVRRIRNGEGVTAAEYIARRRELEEMRRSIAQVFADVDLLVTPTTPATAPTIAELKADPEALRPAELNLLHNTRPFNVWGLPAISVPCGVTKNGLPIGLQVAGPQWREDLVLRLAHAYEKAAG